jgi:hypothetical protein
MNLNHKAGESVESRLAALEKRMEKVESVAFSLVRRGISTAECLKDNAVITKQELIYILENMVTVPEQLSKPPVPQSECDTVRTFDASTWAKSFNETLVKLGHQPHDEGWLQTWFANAIMCGYDHANKPTPSDEPKTIQDVTLDDVILATTSDEPKEMTMSQALPRYFPVWCRLHEKDGNKVMLSTAVKATMDAYNDGLRRAIGKGNRDRT